MKNRVLALLALAAVLTLPARAEFRQVELKIFGMD
jgi:hypothetical protein